MITGAVHVLSLDLPWKDILCSDSHSRGFLVLWFLFGFHPALVSYLVPSYHIVSHHRPHTLACSPDIHVLYKRHTRRSPFTIPLPPVPRERPFANLNNHNRTPQSSPIPIPIPFPVQGANLGRLLLSLSVSPSPSSPSRPSAPPPSISITSHSTLIRPSPVVWAPLCR